MRENGGQTASGLTKKMAGYALHRHFALGAELQHKVTMDYSALSSLVKVASPALQQQTVGNSIAFLPSGQVGRPSVLYPSFLLSSLWLYGVSGRRMNMPIESSSQSTAVKNKRETKVKSGVFLELNRSVAELHIHHSTEAGLTRYPPNYQT